MTSDRGSEGFIDQQLAAIDEQVEMRIANNHKMLTHVRTTRERLATGPPLHELEQIVADLAEINDLNVERLRMTSDLLRTCADKIDLLITSPPSPELLVRHLRSQQLTFEALALATQVQTEEFNVETEAEQQLQAARRRD